MKLLKQHPPRIATRRKAYWLKLEREMNATMSNSKETSDLLRKERWSLSRRDDGYLMVHTEGDIVCHTDPNHEPGDFADEVRFKVIAAAPDMLSALKHISRCAAISDAWLAPVLDAISKAEALQ